MKSPVATAMASKTFAMNSSQTFQKGSKGQKKGCKGFLESAELAIEFQSFSTCVQFDMLRAIFITLEPNFKLLRILSRHENYAHSKIRRAEEYRETGLGGLKVRVKHNRPVRRAFPNSEGRFHGFEKDSP